MRCYECGQDAVAVCRWCFVGQCHTHRTETIARYDRQPAMSCHHAGVTPTAGAAR